MLQSIMETFQEYFLKLLVPRTLITVAAMAILVAVLAVIGRKKVFGTRILTYGALAITAAFILSYIRVFRMPYGGTITLASMLPIFIFAYIAGTRAGLMAGICYGLLQYIQDPFFVHPVQFLLDYPLAFALLGLAGIFKENYFLGALAGSAGRFICHFLSGAVFFGEYANGQNVFLYSFIYNGSFLLPDMIICMAVLLIPNMRTAIKRVCRQAHAA